MGNPTNISSAWVTTEGEVIHPDAPAGAGGSGRFRAATPWGVGQPINPALPAPDAPTVRYLATVDPLNASNTVVNPPPPTKPGVTPLKKQKDANNDIDVQVEVLADIEDGSIQGEADTKPSVVGMNTVFPEVETTNGKVTKMLTPFTLKGKITIQIRYKTGTDKKALSAYGRGTTTADKAAGDLSVGFHESCHVNDHLTWMKAHPLPVFTGKVGMTEGAYQRAMADFSAAIDRYVDDSDKNTEKLTDEVGAPTRSQWLAAGKP